MRDTFESLDSLPGAVLDAVCGGAIVGPGTRRAFPPPPPEARTWSEDLDRKTNRMPGEPKGRVIVPPNPNIDRGIERRWDPFATRRNDGEA